MTAEASLRPLEGCRVLVVEDEFFIADDLVRLLDENGAEVLGPAATLAKAVELLKQVRPDCAVVDVNLRGEMAYPLADQLRRREVPFVFATGYDAAVVPSDYRDVRCWQKPYDLDELIRMIPDMVKGH